MRLITILFLITSFSNHLFSKEVILIGISGGTGSGKSNIAQKLHQAFPENSIIICQDNYYKDLAHLEIEERDIQNFDHPDSIEFTLWEKQLQSLKSFVAIDLPQYDFTTHTRKDYSKEIQPKQIIIVEGLLLFSEPIIRDLLDIKIYVDTPDALS